MAIYLGENKVDGGGNNGTSTPTIDEVAEFDANAKMNSTDMTSQEVDDFVDGLNISGINAADYIVEQGTSGDWIYRKWNSGVAECWRITSVSVTSYPGWGNQYYSSPYGTATFPTGLFTETPVVNVFRTGGAEGATVASGITKTGITQLYIVRPNAGATGTLYFSIHAIGKWK